MLTALVVLGSISYLHERLPAALGQVLGTNYGDILGRWRERTNDQGPTTNAEEYNLASQIRRAAVSIALNIAEGSTSQTDPEQARFLAMAIRSLIETVACQHLIHRRNYLDDTTLLREAYQASEKLVAKLQAMRRAILSDPALREEGAEYTVDPGTPFD